jgi:hypothetical protein
MKSPSKHQVNKQKGMPHTAIYIKPDFKKNSNNDKRDSVQHQKDKSSYAKTEVKENKKGNLETNFTSIA